MKLIIIYGPPAVGKLSIAKELSRLLNYKLLYNHMLINIFDNIFPFNNPIRRELTREFRKRIIEEAIKENLDLIITIGTAGSKTIFGYLTKLIDLVISKKGYTYLIHLTADDETLLSRVEDEFRKGHGKEFGKKELKKLLNKHQNLFDKYPNCEHLSIDTRKISPTDAAQQVIEYYGLK